MRYQGPQSWKLVRPGAESRQASRQAPGPLQRPSRHLASREAGTDKTQVIIMVVYWKLHSLTLTSEGAVLSVP